MSEPFGLSVKLPTNSPADVRVRVGLALIEAGINRIQAAQTRQFEQACIDNEAPVDHLADLLEWHHEHQLGQREQALAEFRELLAATSQCEWRDDVSK